MVTIMVTAFGISVIITICFKTLFLFNPILIFKMAVATGLLVDLHIRNLIHPPLVT